jgi:hypothetical protein
LRRITTEQLSGEPARAERDGLSQLGLLVDTTRKLQETAANIEGYRTACAPAEPAADGQESEPGFVRIGQQLKVDARFTADAIKNFRSVARVP